VLTIVASMEQELVLLRKQLEGRADASEPEASVAADLRVIGVGRSAAQTAVNALLQRQGMNGDRSPSMERLLLLGVMQKRCLAALQHILML